MRLLQTKSSLVPKFVQMIIEEGGEGIILQQVGSLYERGRSSALLKIKVFIISYAILFVNNH